MFSSFLYSHQNGFCFGVQLDSIGSLFSANAALLETAEGERRINQMVAVYPHRTGFDPFRQPVGEAEVLRPYAGSQTVESCRLLSCLIDIGKAVRDKDRTKFLPYIRWTPSRSS